MTTIGGVFIDKHNNKRPEPNMVSVLNSYTTDVFAAGEIFQGVGEEVSQCGRAGIAISTENKTRGTLTIEVSHDNINWGGPSRDWIDTSIAQPHMWLIVEKYFRIKYVNGPFAARKFSIQTQYTNNDGIQLGHQLNEVLLDETEATITRSILVGKDADGEYHNIAATHDGKLQIETDPFAHLQVEILTTLRQMNKYLEIISGNELIDKDKDV